MSNVWIQLPVMAEKKGKLERAHLFYEGELARLRYYSELGIEDADATEWVEAKSDIIVSKNNESIERVRKGPTQIRVKPDFCVHANYILDGNRVESLYPPSSDGWLGRLDMAGYPVWIFIHKTTEETKLWLSIVDRNNMQIYEAHTVHLYESKILELPDEFEEYMGVIRSLRNPDEAEKWMRQVLNGPSSTWSELSRITSDIYIPNLRLRKTMKETMESLVPEVYGDKIREQIMAFLALATKWEVPNEDPLDYFERLRPLGVLLVLLQGYVKCVLEEKRIPSYVKILRESSKHLLAKPTRPLVEIHRENPWYLAHHKIQEQIPQTIRTSLHYAAMLNETNKVIVKLPISGKEAAVSNKKWRERFHLFEESLRIRTHPNPYALGLVRLIDVTRAHQWPHKHLKWSASIGGGAYREPHIQTMEMPPLAAKRVQEYRPNAVEIQWSASEINVNLYNEKTNEWKVSFARVANSMHGSRTLKKLGNEFGFWSRTPIYPPKLDWVKCLDATSNLGYLASFEEAHFLQKLGLTSKELLSTLKELNQKSITKISYSPSLRGLMNAAILAQGPSTSICSLARGFLKHAPSATVSLGNGAEWLLALIRIPPSSAHQIMSELPEEASKEGVSLTCHRAISFRSYTWGFYKRILKEDGTWDDDVSAMLSQIRLPQPHDTS